MAETTIGQAPLSRGRPFGNTQYFRGDPTTGIIKNPTGHRMVALSSSFLQGFHDALSDECGPAADAVLKTCGRSFGELTAKRFASEIETFFRRSIRDLSLAVLDGCVTDFLALSGWGLLRMEYDGFRQGVLVAHVSSPIYGRVLGPMEQPSEGLMAGFLAGFLGELMGQDLGCEQTRCTTRGHGDAAFVLALSERLSQVPGWVAEGLDHDEIVDRVEKSRVEQLDEVAA